MCSARGQCGVLGVVWGDRGLCGVLGGCLRC